MAPRPGGDPGLPVQFRTRRVIRVEAERAEGREERETLADGRAWVHGLMADLSAG